MRTFDVPKWVKDSQAARERARRPKRCVYDGCDSPAAAARGGRAARCAEHDRSEFTPPPIPDPRRTLAGLRARQSQEA